MFWSASKGKSGWNSLLVSTVMVKHQNISNIFKIFQNIYIIYASNGKMIDHKE